MSDRSARPMEPPHLSSCYLRSTSSVSLNERFSQVLLDQVTRPRVVTFDPVQVQPAPPPMVLLVERERPPLRSLQRLVGRRRSVWTRLGWRQVTQPSGFWSFKKKYRWSTRFTSTCRRQVKPCGRLGRRRLLKRRKFQKLTAGGTPPKPHPPGGVVTPGSGRAPPHQAPPTRKQLDAELEEYMSRSKRRLDAELEEYMNMTELSL